jgi:hypothetical protein
MAYCGPRITELNRKNDPIIAKSDAMNTKNASTPLGSMLIGAKSTTKPPKITSSPYAMPTIVKNKKAS